MVHIPNGKRWQSSKSLHFKAKRIRIFLVDPYYAKAVYPEKHWDYLCHLNENICDDLLWELCDDVQLWGVAILSKLKVGIIWCVGAGLLEVVWGLLILVHPLLIGIVETSTGVTFTIWVSCKRFHNWLCDMGSKDSSKPGDLLKSRRSIFRFCAACIVILVISYIWWFTPSLLVR
jgi:hypothetical protein